MFILMVLATLPGMTQHPGPHTQVHDFGNVQWALRAYEDPERDRWQKPDQVVTTLHLHPGQMVVDIGASTGYFARRLARAVGPTGKVLALEIHQTLVDYMKQRAQKEKQANLLPRVVKPDDPELAAGSVDLVLMVETLHHIGGRPAYYEKLKKALKPDGRVAIVDFLDKMTPVGPPLHMRISAKAMRAELEAAGFEVMQAPTFLPYQYFLIARVARAASPTP
jgi:predicted methyltransferase